MSTALHVVEMYYAADGRVVAVRCCASLLKTHAPSLSGVVAVGQAVGGCQQQGDAVQDEHNSSWPAGAGQ